MKVIICGGRDFDNYPFMCDKLDVLFANNKPTEIVSGGQKTVDPDDETHIYGADWLGEVYAWDHQIELKVFPADWSIGRKAGPRRNQQMAEYATHCVAFWDGKSRGTKDMILRAKAMRLNVRVVNY